MTGWQVPGLPRMPGLSETLGRLQTQTEVLADLPATIAELQRVVAGLADLTAATKETMESALRVSSRIEAVLDEIEEPIRALRPGIERLSVALDHSAVDRVPDTLTAIEQSVLPISAAMTRWQARWQAVAGMGAALAARLTALVRRRPPAG